MEPMKLTRSEAVMQLSIFILFEINATRSGSVAWFLSAENLTHIVEDAFDEASGVSGTTSNLPI